jgi:hypothetical protein
MVFAGGMAGKDFTTAGTEDTEEEKKGSELWRGFYPNA